MTALSIFLSVFLVQSGFSLTASVLSYSYDVIKATATAQHSLTLSKAWGSSQGQHRQHRLMVSNHVRVYGTTHSIIITE